MEIISVYFYNFIGTCLYYYTHLKDQIINTLFAHEVIEDTDNHYRYKITDMYITDKEGNRKRVNRDNFNSGFLFLKEDHSDKFVTGEETFEEGGYIEVHYDLILNETGEYSSYIFIYENTMENSTAFPPHCDDILKERNNSPGHKKHVILAGHLKQNDDDINITDVVRKLAGPLHDFYCDSKGFIRFEDITRHAKTNNYKKFFVDLNEYDLTITDGNVKEHKFNKDDERLQFLDLSFDVEILDLSKLKLDLSKLSIKKNTDTEDKSNDNEDHDTEDSDESTPLVSTSGTSVETSDSEVKKEDEVTEE